MATTLYIPFQPSGLKAPEFMVNLAGTTYQVVVTWNLSAQRYYFNLYANDGTWIVTAPLIASESGVKISDIVYDAKMRSITVTLIDPNPHIEGTPYWDWDRGHQPALAWRAPGQMVDWTLEGVDPASLNGLHRCEMLNRLQFMFSLDDVNPWQTTDPGPITLMGSAHRYINLVEGYIPNSTLIFRNESFETS